MPLASPLMGAFCMRRLLIRQSKIRNLTSAPPVVVIGVSTAIRRNSTTSPPQLRFHCSLLSGHHTDHTDSHHSQCRYNHNQIHQKNDWMQIDDESKPLKKRKMDDKSKPLKKRKCPISLLQGYCVAEYHIELR
ncbi:unnamed protein product [Camellia sinensis]